MRRLVCALCAVVLLASCTGGGGGGSPASSGASTSTSSALALRPGQVLHHIGATFQYGGFLITIGDAVYDSEERELVAGVRFRNLGGHWNMTGLQAVLHVGSVSTPLIAGGPVDVPPKTAADLTVTFPSLDADPIGAGTIAWGKDDTNQPVVVLADGHVEHGWIPADVALEGWGRIGKYAIHVTGGQVLAGQLNFDAQAPPAQRILRVDFDEFAAHQDPVNGFYPLEHLSLVRPDGTTAEGVDSSEGLAPVSWTTAPGSWIELPIGDDPAGDYTLLLSSVSTKGFSTFHPELIERAPIALHLGKVEPGAPPDEPTPQPVLRDPNGTEPAGNPVNVELNVGSVNVPGMLFTPRHLRWDPTARSATLDGTATVLERDDSTKLGPTDPAAAAGALLDVTPTFSFSELLVSRGRSYTGVVSGDAEVPRGTTKAVSIEFLLVDELDPDDVGVYIGLRSSLASSIPLGPRSNVPLYPPAPDEQPVRAAPVTAGDWTVHLTGYRVGLLQTTDPPAPGRRALEVIMDVTASPTAQVKALGLSFRASVQLFVASPNGYMLQAVGDSGLVQFEPGATHRASVTFHVPDSFSAGRRGFVLRGGDETADVTTDVFIETTFAAELGSAAGTKAGGSL